MASYTIYANESTDIGGGVAWTNPAACRGEPNGDYMLADIPSGPSTNAGATIGFDLTLVPSTQLVSRFRYRITAGHTSEDAAASFEILAGGNSFAYKNPFQPGDSNVIETVTDWVTLAEYMSAMGEIDDSSLHVEFYSDLLFFSDGGPSVDTIKVDSIAMEIETAASPSLLRSTNRKRRFYGRVR